MRLGFDGVSDILLEKFHSLSSGSIPGGSKHQHCEQAPTAFLSSLSEEAAHGGS